MTTFFFLIDSKHHYKRASKTPFKWCFADGPTLNAGLVAFWNRTSMLRNPIFGDFSGWGVQTPCLPMSCLLFMKKQFLENSPNSLIAIAIVNMPNKIVLNLGNSTINAPPLRQPELLFKSLSGCIKLGVPCGF